jgi:hypothetical protein
MRRLVLFLVIVAGLLGVVAAFDWWVDPAGDIYKPAALTAAMQQHCLLSEELVGARYLSFKLDIFHRRPTTTIVVGSSRVLKIESHPGERTFSNLGFPGTAPETILALFQALPAKPAQTVYLGVEAFWFNSVNVVPTYRPTTVQLAEYLLSRSTFQLAFRFVRQAHYILFHRWAREAVGRSCVIGRQSPGIAWNVDGSRTFSYELDPNVPRPHASRHAIDLSTFDARPLDALRRALDLARRRGWKVVGFAPPEPPQNVHQLEHDPRVRPNWQLFLERVPRLFREEGFTWAGLWDGAKLGCRPTDYPDGFHSDAACSSRLRARLDRAAAG